MILKDFGTRSGLKVAPVSLGVMRLPGDSLQATKVVRHAIDKGIKYIDTSRCYGETELLLGRALTDGYRERVFLSTKSSPWTFKITDQDDGSAESLINRIKEQLFRLNTDYLDFYQVWSINNKETWDIASKPGGMVDGIKQAMKSGLVKHSGFTTHQNPDELLQCLNDAEWCEVILVSYNLFQNDYAKVLKKAHELGIGTIVMNPVGGGKFVEDSPVLKKLATKLGVPSVLELALRYVFSNPYVDTILCGANKISDIDSTVAISQLPPFSDEEILVIQDFIENLSRDKVSFCTSCGYCKPCPQGIQIPEIMSAVYEEKYLGFFDAAKYAFNNATKDVSPIVCTECGVCEKKCTQHLNIIQELKYATDKFLNK